MDKETCKDCFFLCFDDQYENHCRRYPGIRAEGKEYMMFPRVSDHYWCGEFKDKGK